MPLPPLPENNTIRAWLKYTSQGEQHELCFRVPLTATTTDAHTVAVALANGLKSLMNTTDSFQALRISNVGSNLSFPVAWTAIAGTGSAPGDASDKAEFISVVGRSAGGYRCRLTFFTAYYVQNNGYRINVATPLYNTAISTTPALASIEGVPVIWNAYTNRGFNAYWQRELR
jgi:hypothetical protein